MHQLSPEAVQSAAQATTASRVDCYGVGATSNFATDLQARLFRLGLASNSYLDPHVQLISAATIARGVVMADRTWAGCRRGRVRWMSRARARHHHRAHPGGSPLAKMADILLAIESAPDPAMPVGPEAYLAHLVIEVLTVAIAQRLGR